MAGQALVVFRNLLPEILLLGFQKGFRILALKATNEEAEESFDECAKAFEHSRESG